MDASANSATRQVPMMIAVRLRMPAPLQFVRKTTSIPGLDRRPKGQRACSIRYIIPYGRVLGSETAVARVADG